MYWDHANSKVPLFSLAVFWNHAYVSKGRRPFSGSPPNPPNPPTLPHPCQSIFYMKSLLPCVLSPDQNLSFSGKNLFHWLCTYWESFSNSESCLKNIIRGFIFTFSVLFEAIWEVRKDTTYCFEPHIDYWVALSNYTNHTYISPKSSYT